MPSMPSGRMRSPSLQVRTSSSSPRASASSVARSGPAGSTGPGRTSARTSQRPNRQLPGTRSETGSGAASASERDQEPNQSVLADRPHAVAQVDLAPLGKGGQAHDLAPRGAVQAGPPVRWRAPRAPAERGAAGRAPSPPAPSARIATAPAPAPAASSASSTTRSRRCASSTSSACVSAMFRSAAGLSSCSAGSTWARTRLRAKSSSRFDSSSANGRQASAARRRVSARSSSSSGRTRRPLCAGRPRSARVPGGDGKAVQHRLGEVGPRVAGGDPVAARARAELLGGGVAGLARRGLEVSVRGPSAARCGGRCEAASRGRGRRARRASADGRRP